MKTTKIIEIDGDKFASALTDTDLLQLTSLLVKAGLQKVGDGHIPTAESRYEINAYYVQESQVEIKITLTGKEVMPRDEFERRRDEGERIYEAALAEKTAKTKQAAA